MTKKEKIKQFIIQYIDKNAKTVSRNEILSIVEALENDGLISFYFAEHETDCDYWISAETSMNMKDSKFIGITFDFNIKLYDDEGKEINEFVDYILGFEKEAKKIINKLKNNT